MGVKAKKGDPTTGFATKSVVGSGSAGMVGATNVFAYEFVQMHVNSCNELLSISAVCVVFEKKEGLSYSLIGSD